MPTSRPSVVKVNPGGKGPSEVNETVVVWLRPTTVKSWL
jgi:hypothetical protein